MGNEKDDWVERKLKPWATAVIGGALLFSIGGGPDAVSALGVGLCAFYLGFKLYEFGPPTKERKVKCECGREYHYMTK